MNETSTPPGGEPRPGNPVLRQATAWIACGRRLVLEQQSLWYGMAAIYIVIGFLLTLIPFMGHLLLILISPMLLASVIWGRAQEPQGPPAPEAGRLASARALLQTWVGLPAQELLRIFAQPDKVPGAVLLGIITLGFTILVMAFREWLVGGPMLTGLEASKFALQVLMILKMLFIVMLYILLTMGLFFSVPLTMLGNRQPLAAIFESFSTCRENAKTLLTLVLPFLLVYVVIQVALIKYGWLGYLLLASIGLLALPLFIAAVYCSYLTLYPPKFPDRPPETTDPLG